MITKVILKNWRSHLESELVFTEGTNALLGILGSGKSSVLDAICFGLFGTFPNLQSRKLKIEDLIMKKPVEKTRGEVEVYFSSNGSTFSVRRTIEKGKGTSYSELRENGKILEAASTSRVTELVEKVLKVNYDLFSKAIYSEQNALDYFLTIPKGQRMKKIDELLMIDRFEKARMGTTSLINKLVERKLGKQSIVENINMEELQKIIVELKNSADRIWSEKVMLEKEFSSITAERIRMEREVAGMQRMKFDLEILKREESGVNLLIEETYRSLQEIEKNLKDVDKDSIEKNLREFVRYIGELDEILKDKMKEYERSQERFAKSKAEVEFIKKEKLDILESELQKKLEIKKNLDKNKKLVDKNLESELESKRRELEKFVGEIEAMKIKIRELQEILDQLSSIEGKCPLCESKLTEEKKIILIKQKAFQIDSLREKISNWENKREISEQDITDLEESIEKLEQMLEEVKDLDKVKTDFENSKNIFIVLNEDSEKLKFALQSNKTEIENFQLKLRDMSDKRQRYEMLAMYLRDYQDKKTKIETLMIKRTDLEARLSEFQKSLLGVDTSTIEISLRALISKEKETEMKIKSIEQIVKEKEIRMKDFEHTYDTAAKEKEEISKLDKLVHELKIFERSLEQTQVELRKEFVTSVNFAMNELWQNLYPYQDFSGAKLAIEENDYVLQLLEKSGKWSNVEGFASGGERSIAALTLRIAFALVLAPQLKWLVLDEPTHNLDAKAVEDLAATLSERIGNFVDQVFLITHDEKLENAVTGNLYRLEREKEKDGFTRVIAV